MQVFDCNIIIQYILLALCMSGKGVVLYFHCLAFSCGQVKMIQILFENGEKLSLASKISGYVWTGHK